MKIEGASPSGETGEHQSRPAPRTVLISQRKFKIGSKARALLEAGDAAPPAPSNNGNGTAEVAGPEQGQ